MFDFDVCFSVLWDPVKFLSFVGADEVITEQREERDTAGPNRGQVSGVKKKIHSSAQRRLCLEGWLFCFWFLLITCLCFLAVELLFVCDACGGEACAMACRPGRSESRWIRGGLQSCWSPHLQKPLCSSVSGLPAQPAGSNKVCMPMCK